MSARCFMVLDQGSSNSRAVAVGTGGAVIAKTSRRLLAGFPAAGLAEYDANRLLQSQLDALDELLDAIPPAFEIAGLGVTSQRSTVVLWDKKTGEPLAPVLSWQDGRAAELLDSIAVAHEEIHAVTGLYKTPYFSAPKILWCLKNCPPVKKAAEEGRLAAGPVASYIVWKLTGGAVFASDPTLAQRMLLFDLRDFNWSARLLELFSVPEGCLPRLQPSVADYGVYNSRRGAIEIRAMLGDQQSAMLGAGAFASDSAMVNYGTGAFFMAATGGRRSGAAGMLESAAWQSSAGGKTYLLEGAVTAASSMLDWLNQLGLQFSVGEIDALCAQSRTPPLVLCALGGIGSPYWDYKTATVVAGLTPETKKADMVRGTLEGLAHLVGRNAFAALESGAGFSKVLASGGLSNSDFLLQFQSDLLQLPVVRSAEPETTALGAAWLLAKSSGADTAGWFAGGKVFSPSVSPEKAKKLAARWLAFYESARAMSAKISE